MTRGGSTERGRGGTRSRRDATRRRATGAGPGLALPRTPGDLAAAAALLVAILLGGSQQLPLHTVAAECAAVAAILVLFLAPGAGRTGTLAPAAIVATLAIVVLLIETVPLPYPLWTALPGRALAVAARAAAGVPPATRPLSLDPYATAGAMLALLPGLALFVAGLVADRGQIRLLAAIVVAGAVAGTLLGVVQAGSGAGYLYDHTFHANAVGFFANRNHQVDMLLIAMPLAAAFGRDGRGGRNDTVIAAGIVAFLAAGVIAAGSRAGFALLGPVLAATAALMLVRSHGGRAATLLGAAAAIVGLLALTAFSPAVARLLARYQTTSEDLRFDYWRNTLFAIRQYWPAGSGLGSFVPVYQTVEPLGSLVPPVANHAHDDYLELLLELGVVGAALIVAYHVALGWALWRNVRHGGVWRAAAGIAILVPLAHSLVDYPLRTPALMAVFGLLNAIVFRRIESAVPRNRG